MFACTRIIGPANVLRSPATLGNRINFPRLADFTSQSTYPILGFTKMPDLMWTCVFVAGDEKF